MPATKKAGHSLQKSIDFAASNNGGLKKKTTIHEDEYLNFADTPV